MMPQDRCRRPALDYAGHVAICEGRRRRCSLNSSIPVPGKPLPSASTVVSPSTAPRVRLRRGAEPVWRSHRGARPAASRAEKSGTPVSSMRCATATCDAPSRSPSVHRIRTSVSIRRSAPGACAPSDSRSNRTSTVQFSVAFASTREMAADERRCRSIILMNDESRVQRKHASQSFPLSQGTEGGSRG
jgi:hypothetical protein